ncbi:hypothetical protein TKK_0014589 [Trichogramma kaykai]
MGKADFTATIGWCTRWLKRENIVYGKMHGELNSNDYVGAHSWLKTVWPRLAAQYNPSDIYNADETALYYRALPESCYLFRHENAKGSKTCKERITVLVCASMVGEKKDFLVIGKSANPRCFKLVKKLPVDYENNTTAWMTSKIFSNWLYEWNKQLIRKILPLIDNCADHKNPPKLKNIEIGFLPANTTALIQPCDQDAIHLIKKSWENNVSETTIQNCFKKAGFIESDPGIDELNDLPTNNDEIPHELYNDESIKNIEESSDNEDGRNECLHDIVPSQREIFNSMNTLRRAVHHYSDNFDLH